MADQGFGAMDDDKQRIIASEGGKASTTEKDMTHRMSDAGKKGAKAQSSADKAKGGKNSHRTTE